MTPDELALIRQFLEHEPEISSAVQRAVLRASPEGTSEEDLKSLVGLYSVHIHQVSRNGAPYVGYELGCNWNEASGIGVLTNGSRIVEVGTADTALLLWLAERDLRSATLQ